MRMMTTASSVFHLWMLSQLTSYTMSLDHRNHLRGEKKHHHQPQHHDGELFQRRLAQSAAERFAYWTTERVKRATPLDLKIDALTGDAYQSGLGGNLELIDSSYSSSDGGAAAVDYDDSNEERTNASYWDSVVPIDELLMKDDNHSSSSSEASQFVNGHRQLNVVNIIIPREQMDESSMISMVDNHDYDDGNASDEIIKEHALHNDRLLNKKDKPQAKKKNVSQGDDDGDADNKSSRSKGSSSQWKRKTPKLRQMKPLRGDTVHDQATFRTKVLPAQDEIAAVYLQLTDFEGISSNYIQLYKSNKNPRDKMYQVTLGGFVQEYAGTTWSYKIIVQERSGVQYNFVDVPFTVASGRNENVPATTATATSSTAPTSTPTPDRTIDNPMVKQTVVTDAEWPHGGAIQTSTGRILFDFGGGDTHVCSGTVVNDGGIYNERSIILTAAHCAYDDVNKKFASNAIFIPDQGRSLAPTDFDCSNDKFGCWYLSFAVIERGWAETAFPENAKFDYAFYVVHGYTATHIKGYTDGLTGYLDQDVIPANLDFAADPQGQYLTSFGYSEEYDPSFRYCAGNANTIREIPNYTNLWLPQCDLQGGASGGPWLVDIDRSGVGTVMSLNSWGFSDGIGMAGPSLQTASGSKAQCLFNVAKTVQDPGSTRGYAISC